MVICLFILPNDNTAKIKNFPKFGCLFYAQFFRPGDSGSGFSRICWWYIVRCEWVLKIVLQT